MLGAGEIVREAKRVMPRMARQGSYIAPLKTNEFGLYSPRNRWRKPILAIPSELVRAFLSHEFIRYADQDDDLPALNKARVFVLSPVGDSFLRRLSRPDAPFRGQHEILGMRYIHADNAANTAYRVNVAESPLGWLHKRKDSKGNALISREQFEAGERLRKDFTKGMMTPRVTSDWAIVPARRQTKRAAANLPDLNETALAARQRVEAAVIAVGPGLSRVLLDVCCHLIGLEQTERDLGWPRRSGKVVLQIALARLADHYGITGKEKRRADRKGNI